MAESGSSSNLTSWLLYYRELRRGVSYLMKSGGLAYKSSDSKLDKFVVNTSELSVLVSSVNNRWNSLSKHLSTPHPNNYQQIRQLVAYRWIRQHLHWRILSIHYKMRLSFCITSDIYWGTRDIPIKTLWKWLKWKFWEQQQENFILARQIVDWKGFPYMEIL